MIFLVVFLAFVETGCTCLVLSCMGIIHHVKIEFVYSIMDGENCANNYCNMHSVNKSGLVFYFA